MRKSLPVIQKGDFTLLFPEDERVFAYVREYQGDRLLVVCNFTADNADFQIPIMFRDGETVISNYEDSKNYLRPYEAKMILKKAELSERM